jgi:hypothetical protein
MSLLLSSLLKNSIWAMIRLATASLTRAEEDDRSFRAASRCRTPFRPTGLLNDDVAPGLVIDHFSNSLP